MLFSGGDAATRQSGDWFVYQSTIHSNLVSAPVRRVGSLRIWMSRAEMHETLASIRKQLESQQGLQIKRIRGLLARGDGQEHAGAENRIDKTRGVAREQPPRPYQAGVAIAVIAGRVDRRHAAQQFDVAYSFNDFEHIDDVVQAMRDIRRALRPGGRLLAYVPALGFLFTSMDAKVGHVRRYTRASLVAAMRAAQFTVDESRYADVAGVPATLAYKWFGKRDGSIDEQALIAYDRVLFPISRALDRVTDRVLGKNVWAIGRPD